MNGTKKEKEIPTITVIGDNKEKAGAKSGDKINNYDDEDDDNLALEKYRRHSSRKASFFIGDEEQIPVTIVGHDNKEICPDDIVVAPDGGYGWVIVFAAFMTNFVADGTIFSFGILLEQIMKSSNGEVKPDSAAWIGSLLTGFYLMTGPVVSSLCNKIGFRWTGIIGSIIATIGFVLAWYFNRDGVPHMLSLFLCYGLLGGIGFGLAYMPSIICVGFYFSKKRALATGIAICGSGIGTFVYAPLIEFLIFKFGWAGSLLIQAALILTCVAYAALYRPLHAESVGNNIQTPYQTPDGTPLLLRIKRARELEKWDSVTSFSSNDGFGEGSRRSITNPLIANGATTLSMDETKAKSDMLYENARKSSANSLPGIQHPPKVKKLSVPAMGEFVATGLVVPQRTGSIKNKSFVGLPVSLEEIAEETEINADEHGSGKEVLRSRDDVLSNLPSKRSIFLRRSSTMGAGSDGLRRRSSGTMTLVLSSSTLNPMEMSQSRILRVETSKTTLNKPLLRDDIFYSGSLSRIPEYSKNADAVFSSMNWVTPHIVSSQGFTEEEPKLKKKKSKFLVLRKMLDFSLLGSPTFLILAISGSVTMLGFFIPFIYSKAVAEIHIQPSQATFLISIIGISNTIARIFVGALADRPFINPLIINNTALTLGGIAILCVPHIQSHALFIVYACIFGISVACFASLRSILIVELLGLSKLTNAFGLLCLFQGVAALVGSPLAGFLRVYTGNYAVTFYVAGAMMILSGVMCYPLHYVNRWEKRRDEARALKS